MRLVRDLKRRFRDGWLSLRRLHAQAPVLTLLVLLVAWTSGCSSENGLIVEPAPGTVLADGIVLERVSTREGDLEQVAFSPQTGQRYAEDRRCLIVSGHLRNTTDKLQDVDMWVDGYNSEGELVTSTLASEAQEGYLHLDLPGETRQDFESSAS